MTYRFRVTTSAIAIAAIAVIQQPAMAQPNQINQIQVNSVNGTLEVRLELSGDAAPEAFTARYGNTVVIDLTNIQLSLPSDATSGQTSQGFLQENPATDIASIRVEPLDANSVRITVTGQDQSPSVTLTEGARALIVSAAGAEVATDPPSETPPPAQANEAEEGTAPNGDVLPPLGEGIRIVVTGEQADAPYLAPETTTGTRTDTSLFDIPQAIQIIPERVLEDQQVIRLNEALRNVPNAVQDNTFGGTNDEFVIRGFDLSTILRDGFRTGSSVDSLVGIEETANVERIEILSGPGSILFGNVQPGGVINLVTERPLSEFAFEAGIQAGSFDLVRPTLDISGPLTDDGDLLYRLNAAYEYEDGFRDFDTDVNRFFLAPVLEWQVGERTNLAIELEYIDDQRPFDRGIPAFGDGVADVPLDTIIGEPEDFAETTIINVGYRLEHDFSDHLSLRNRFRYLTSDLVTRRAELSAPLGGLDETTGEINRAFLSNDSRLESFEVQTELVGEFTTGPIDHTLLLALDLFFADADANTTTDFAPAVNLFDPETGLFDPPDPPLAFTTLDAQSELDRVGLVLQDQIEIFEDLTLLLGGRLDFINQRIESAPTLIPGLLDSPGLDNEESYSNFSPRVGIVYKPIEPLSLYVSYSQSFEPNSQFQTTIEGDFLDPQEAEQFEIGAKAELLNGRLAVTLALFDIDLENAGVPDPDNPEFFVPIGEQTSRGVELVVQGEILPGWNIIGSYGLVDAEIEESEDFPEGATPSNVADNTGSLFTTYEIQRGALQGLGFGLGLFFVDDRPGDDENTFELDSFLRTDAALFYRTERLRLGLNFRNIFDVDFFESSIDRRGAIPGEPFNVLGSVSVTF